ncbi:MAG: mannose-1-phosphate guanylyltransferase [Candidatus Kapabacteria bacterium]|nr:mannose-1-phosphate guanylyltransferase [Ignavibacteriota bacterium]MCW5885438.1 mannose-1-phosphate guanylyltransferase [Candidatus Kapabacteria bacterium]
MKKTAVIMAGGFGERFWPLSRMKRPKQVLNLTSPEKNMMQEAIDRIRGLIAPEDIFVITSKLLLEPIRMSLPELPPQNIIAEPAKRNTAPCLALASAVIKARYSEITADNILTAVLTADHKIEPKENFNEIINEVFGFVASNDVLATIGINPTRPETGYGYIEVGKDLSGRIRKVKSFREKPDLESAQKFVKSGNFFWNSGMFFWKLSTFDSEMILNCPEIGNYISELTKLYSNYNSEALNSFNSPAEELFSSLPSISIDYALMEKSANVVCIKSDFNWDDVGAWDSLERVREKDENSNILTGNNLLIDSNNCIIINDNSTIQKVTGIGIENLIIINTGDSIMICPKDRAQDVKLIVNELRNNNEIELL